MKDAPIKRKGVEEMKKLISVVLSGAMLASVFLCGCNTKPAETETEETTTEATTTVAETEPEAHIDPDKLKAVTDYYESKITDDHSLLSVYMDGVRGGCDYYISDGRFYFSYDSFQGESQLTLSIDTYTESVDVSFMLYYGDARYYGRSNDGVVKLDSVEAFIDDIISKNSSAIDIYEEDAYSDNVDKIKADIPIVYARLIAIAEKAFPELGFGVEDLGLDFGDKYRNVDPKTLTSEEKEVKNEHKFVNGVCEDCGMKWVDYYYEAIGNIDRHPSDSEWHSIYGQDSASMFSLSDYVQCSSYGRGDAELYYHRSIMKDPESTMAGAHTEDCRLYIKQDKKSTTSSVVFRYEEGMYSVGQGIVDFKFSYYMRVEAKDGDYSKIFESKESLKKNAELYLFVTDDDGVGHDVWSSKKDDEIKKMFDELDFTVYFTKDEFIDMIWEHYSVFFASMDNAIVWLDTSLADAGIKWKKED